MFQFSENQFALVSSCWYGSINKSIDFCGFVSFCADKLGKNEVPNAWLICDMLSSLLSTM